MAVRTMRDKVRRARKELKERGFTRGLGGSLRGMRSPESRVRRGPSEKLKTLQPLRRQGPGERLLKPFKRRKRGSRRQFAALARSARGAT